MSQILGHPRWPTTPLAFCAGRQPARKWKKAERSNLTQRDKPSFEDRVKAVPRWDMRPRSSAQPLAPRLCGLPEVPAELRDIPGDAVVGVMAYELRGQPFPLVHQRLMAVVPTPVVDRDQRAGEPALGGSLAHHFLSLLRFYPSVGSSDKVGQPFPAVRMRAPLTFSADID